MKKKKYKRKCKHCGDISFVNVSTKKCIKDRCRSCAAKERFGTLDHDDKNLWKSPCKKCGDMRIYTHKKSWKQKRDLCISCSQIKNDDDYRTDMNFYIKMVRRLTRKEDLSSLENFEKRGRTGIKGAYQVDHIISIKEGFLCGMHPIEIAHIKNLQMLPWEENLKKSWKSVK